MLKKIIALMSILAFAQVAFAGNHDKKAESTNTEVVTEKMEGDHNKKNDADKDEKMEDKK